MNEDPEQTLVSKASAIGGLVVGLLHAVVAIFFWNYFFDDLQGALLSNHLTGSYIIVGMFALGFVPVILYTSRKTISPLLIVSLLLIVSVFDSWRVHPIGAPRGTPSGFGVYIFLWVGVIALAGLASDFERKLR